MDSRDQGKSGGSPDKLTYEKMTDDLAALLEHLKTGPVDVLGWSDGGIEALLLGIRHPAKVKKIVAMAANLNPSDKAVRPEVLDLIDQHTVEIYQHIPNGQLAIFPNATHMVPAVINVIFPARPSWSAG